MPAGAWHTVEVLEPCVIFEAKDGKYGEDGSETLADYENKAKTLTQSIFSNSLGDLKKNIEYIIGMERQSGSMDAISPLYVSRMLNVPLGDDRDVLKLRPGITGPATLKYRLEDEMISDYVAKRQAEGAKC